MIPLAIGMNRLWLALPLVLAFSAGLAGVLIALGIVVVQFKKLADSKFGEGPIVKALPIISAIVIIGMGGWLCYDAVQNWH